VLAVHVCDHAWRLDMAVISGSPVRTCSTRSCGRAGRSVRSDTRRAGRSSERGAFRGTARHWLHAWDGTNRRDVDTSSGRHHLPRSRVRCVSVKVWSRHGAAPGDAGTVSSHWRQSRSPNTVAVSPLFPSSPSSTSPHHQPVKVRWNDRYCNLPGIRPDYSPYRPCARHRIAPHRSIPGSRGPGAGYCRVVRLV
jgi:hypothetical protein